MEDLMGLGLDSEMYENVVTTEAVTRSMFQIKYSPNVPDQCDLFVIGYPRESKRHDIFRLFKHCGKILRVDLRRNRNYAFVTFSKSEEAKAAILDMDGRIIQRGKITVRWARKREKISIIEDFDPLNDMEEPSYNPKPPEGSEKWL